MKNILVTGGAGFIGSCFVRKILRDDPSVHVTTVDALTYCSSMASLEEVSRNPRHQFIHENICQRTAMQEVFRQGGFDAVVNFAAESHVDRSIENPDEFIMTNVVGTHVLLECARQFKTKKFLQVSTDEVYGSLGETGVFTEESPLHPSSPYSASKASADLLCLAYHTTYQMPVVITRSVNAYGPYQYPEKLIPVLIQKAQANQSLPIYGDGRNVRTWIYVEDCASGILTALKKAAPGQVYNLSSAEESRNIDVAKTILKHMGKPETLIQFVTDRPGHDWRYALEAKKISDDLGWRATTKFSDGLHKTVQWYLDNQDWCAAILKKHTA